MIQELSCPAAVQSFLRSRPRNRLVFSQAPIAGLSHTDVGRYLAVPLQEAGKAPLVKTFVYSQTYEQTLIPLICENMDYATTDEHFGLQIVGDYGTGKSHLMSLISIIAEDEALLQYYDIASSKS